MKRISLSFLLTFTAIFAYGQTKINFSSFDAWRQNSTTKKMEYLKTIYESGYLEINKVNSTVIVYNNKLKQKELFQFTPFKKVANNHYIGFASKQMFTFIPDDKLLLLKVNDIVIMKFSPTSTAFVGSTGSCCSGSRHVDRRSFGFTMAGT